MEKLVPHKIWNQKTPSDKNPAKRYWNRILHLIEKYLPDYFVGKESACASKDALRTFQEKICEMATDIDALGKIYTSMTRVFSSGEKSIGWKGPSLGRLTLVAAKKPILDEYNFHLAKDVDEILRRVVDIIGSETIPSKMSIILSSICFGYNNAPIKELWRGLDNYSLIHDNKQWLLLTSADESKRIIWFSDPISSILISRFFNAQDLTPQKINKCKPQQYKRSPSLTPVTLNDAKLSFKKLKEIVFSWHERRLPPFLCHHDSAIQYSISLNIYQWERIKFGTASRVPIQRKDERTKIESIPRETATFPSDEATQKPDAILAAIDKILSGKHKELRLSEKEYKYALRELAHSCQIAEHPLENACRFALSIQNLAFKTRVPHIKAIVKYILIALDKEIISNHPSEQEWAFWFQFVIENNSAKSQSSRGTLMSSLRKFAQFLILDDQIERSQIDAIPYIGSNKRNANANLITFLDVDLILSKYDLQAISTKRLMEACAIILAFCVGLRASEVLDLKLSDIEVLGGKIVTIITQTHEYHDAKTGKSNRAVRTEVFIPEKYQNFILELIARRCHEMRGNDSLLFSYGVNGRFHRDILLNPCINKFRHLTQDKTLRFHHFRHSFANWNLLRLMASTYPTLIDKNCHALNHHELSPDKISALATSTMHEGFMKSEALRSISERLGHASTDTTLGSYFHFGAWWQSKYASTIIERLSLSQLSTITKKGESILYLYKNKGDSTVAIVERWASPTNENLRLSQGRSISELAEPIDALFQTVPDIYIQGFQINVNSIISMPEQNRSKEELAVLPAALKIIEHNEQKKRRMPNRPLSIHPPKGPKQLQLVIRYYSQLSSANPESPIAKFINLFRHYGAQEGFEIRAKNTEHLSIISNGFRALGFSIKEHVTIRIGVSQKGQCWINEFRKTWSHRAKIPIEHCYQHPRKRDGKSTCGTAYVSVMDWSKAPKDERKAHQKRAEYLGEELHYALELFIRMQLIEGN